MNLLCAQCSWDKLGKHRNPNHKDKKSSLKTNSSSFSSPFYYLAVEVLCFCFTLVVCLTDEAAFVRVPLCVICETLCVCEFVIVLPIMRWGEGLCVLWVEFKLREVVKIQRSGVRGLAGRERADLDLTLAPDCTLLNLKMNK